ncbi:MAG: helix-turn-helix transcriptional regulator, partial [Clostridia bacterium]|nr:helix-turn-helix transcriptional regulator [Clostridia bacterium]
TYSVSEIALKCGFDNVYYFSNMFKKMVGVSPTRYIDSYET